MDYLKKDFLNVTLNLSGLILLSSPREGSLRPTVASFLSISGGHYVGDISEASCQDAINSYSKYELIIASTSGTDSLIALNNLSTQNLDFKNLKLAGVITNDFVKLSCKCCTINTKAKAEVLSSISPCLRTLLAKSHFINRGCRKCNDKGYSCLLYTSDAADE